MIPPEGLIKAMAEAAAPAQVVSHYRLIEKIGRGGMGTVYKARDLRLDRLVALKFLAPRGEGQTPSTGSARNRFEQEARALSSLSHPHIGALFDVQLEGESPYLVLEYLPGGSLESRIRASSMDLASIRKYGRQIALGLGHAHRHGIVHRDLKPANILFDSEDRIKIVDFGISKLLGASERVTEQGTILGTVDYMAPEQVHGPDVDQRVDLWAFGVILYRMAAEVLPFKGESSQATIHQILNFNPKPLTEIRNDIPERFSQLTLKALAKNRERRCQTAEEMGLELECLPADSDSTPTATLATPQSAAAAAEPCQTPPEARARRRIPRLALAALAAVLSATLLFVASPSLRSRLTLSLLRVSLPEQRYVLVLPFESADGDRSGQAIADALAETTTSLLSQVEQFQSAFYVVPAGEVRQQKVNTVLGARRVFNANLVLTGSLRRSGSEMRVILNLVDAASVRQLDSRILTVPWPDEAALEKALLGAVVDMLRLRAAPPERDSLAGMVTQNGRAYDSYLQAKGLLAARKDENLDEAIRLLADAVKRDPLYAPAHIATAGAMVRKFAKTGDAAWLKKADASAAQAISLKANAPDVHFVSAQILSATGRYADAVKELERTLELDPGNADALVYLAGTQRKLLQFDAAEQTYQQAIRRRPAYWVPYSALGWFYYGRARYPEAEQAFLTAIRLAPDHHLNYRNLGGIYLALGGRNRDAIQVLRKSIELEPNGAAYANLGTAYWFEGNYAAAADNYRAAVKLEPEDHSNWGDLADAYSQIPGAQASAAEAYRKARDLSAARIAVNPNQPLLLADLAFYAARLSSASEALVRIGEALRLDPNTSHVLYRAVCIYELAGQRAKAVDFAAKLLTVDPRAAEFRGDPLLAQLRREPRLEKIAKEAATK